MKREGRLTAETVNQAVEETVEDRAFDQFGLLSPQPF